MVDAMDDIMVDPMVGAMVDAMVDAMVNAMVGAMADARIRRRLRLYGQYLSDRRALQPRQLQALQLYPMNVAFYRSIR